MNLRVLEYAVAVAEHGSISAAAKVVLVAQPSLSRQVRQLERELGVELFFREGKGVTLTPAGTKFISIARDLLARSNEAKRAMQSGGDISLLSVVSTQQLHENIVGKAVLDKQLALQRLHVRDSQELATFVLDGHADVGLNAVQPVVGLASRVFTMLPLSLQVLPENDPFLPGPLELTDLPGQLICLEPHRENRRVLNHAVAAVGIKLDVALEVETTDVAQLMAATGRGPCIVSDDAPKYGLTSHRLVSNGVPIELPVYAMWRHGHYAQDGIEQLLELLSHDRSTGTTPVRP